MEIPSQTVDGNDVWAVREAASAALESVRAGRGPAFIQALTYRFVGHSRSDPGAYRPEGELDHWRERDPLVVTARAPRPRTTASAEGELDSVEAEVRAELERCRRRRSRRPSLTRRHPPRPSSRRSAVHVRRPAERAAAENGRLRRSQRPLARLPLVDRC